MISKIDNMSIVGISSVVPDNKVSNYDYDLLSDAEKKMLVRTIGVETRYVAPGNVTTSDLAIEAANRLFKKTKWERESVDVLVFVTQSRDYYLPSVGVIAQNKLGLSTECMAFDVGLGCSGYVYGLNILTSLLKANNKKRGVLLAGDVSTVSCSYEDRSTYPLFGDAGTATFVENNDEENTIYFDLHSDGSGEDAIKIPAGGLRQLPSEEALQNKLREDGNIRSNMHLVLNGVDIFNFSIGVVPKTLSSFMKDINTDSTQIDLFVMHQANLLMNETIRKKLKIDKEKVPYSIKEFGNTSSASIPLTISLLKEVKNQNIMMSGFGVGLSWGNVYIENATIPYLINATY